MASWGMKVQLTGLQDLHDRLEGMKRSIRNRIVRGALRKAAAPMKTAAKAFLQAGHGKETGLLNKSIAVKDKTYASGTVIVLIGPRGDMRRQVDVSGFRVYRQVGGVRGKNRRGKWMPGVFGKTVRITNPNPARLKNWPTMMRNPVKYAHLVEKGITARGKKDAKPFLSPAFTSTQVVASAIFRDHVETELLKLGVP